MTLLCSTNPAGYILPGFLLNKNVKTNLNTNLYEY